MNFCTSIKCILVYIDQAFFGLGSEHSCRFIRVAPLTEIWHLWYGSGIAGRITGRSAEAFPSTSCQSSVQCAVVNHAKNVSGLFVYACNGITRAGAIDDHQPRRNKSSQQCSSGVAFNSNTSIAIGQHTRLCPAHKVSATENQSPVSGS